MFKYNVISKFTPDSPWELERQDKKKKQYKELIKSLPQNFQYNLKRRHITPKQPQHLFPYAIAVCKNNETEPQPSQESTKYLPLSEAEKEDTLHKLKCFLDKHSSNHRSEVNPENIPTEMMVDGIRRAASNFENDTEANSSRTRRFTSDLLLHKEHDELENLLFDPDVGGKHNIAYSMSYYIQRDKDIPQSRQLMWANHLREMTGNRIIEDYGDQMIEKTRTARPLDDYITYLDIQNEETSWHSQILVIGGGNSPISSQLKEQGCSIPIVNIDPIFKEEKSANEDKKYPWNFFDPKTKDLLQNEKFDEAWALYSLPMYALSAREVVDFYHYSFTGLRSRGILRVFPCHDGSYHDFGDAANLLGSEDRMRAAKQIIGLMQERPDLFEVVMYTKRVKSFFSRSGFLIEGTKIQLLGAPQDVDDFFNSLKNSVINNTMLP